MTFEERETIKSLFREVLLELGLLPQVAKPVSGDDEFMMVLTTQGAEAAHKWQKDRMKQRRLQHAN